MKPQFLLPQYQHRLSTHCLTALSSCTVFFLLLYTVSVNNECYAVSRTELAFLSQLLQLLHTQRLSLVRYVIATCCDEQMTSIVMPSLFSLVSCSNLS